MNQHATHLRSVPPAPRPHLAAPAEGGVVINHDHYQCFVGVSTHVADLKRFVGVQAHLNDPALLVGERGLLQVQIARALHDASPRRSQPFISVDTHGLTADAAHELLFGAPGLLKTCVTGTVFISQLTGLAPLLQQRLAVHLEEQRQMTSFRQSPQPRLVFASGDGPAERTAENRIAFGLIEMLRGSALRLRPLRERSEDIPLLARRLADAAARRLGRGEIQLSPDALRTLAEYRWEGNVDELAAAVESMVATLQPRQLDASLIPAHIRQATLSSIPESGIDLPQVIQDFEHSLIRSALRQTGENQTRAARLLGLRVQTLNMKIRRLAERRAPRG
jgi:DNA-binding NtrC family response regulator